MMQGESNRHQAKDERSISGQREIGVLGQNLGINFPGGCSAKPQELTLRYLCDTTADFLSPKKTKHQILSYYVERDFVNLIESTSSSKRKLLEEEDKEKNNYSEEKKPRAEGALNLSLSLPLDLPSNFRSQGDVSSNNVSDDFTSFYTSSRVSHNPSCSLTLTSDQCKDDFVRCGEGTNGSVHSRFRPIGDEQRFGPSVSGDSKRESDMEGRGRQEAALVVEIVSEPIHLAGRIIDELSKETMEAVRDYVKCLLSSSDKKNELIKLQTMLLRRSDGGKEALLKCRRDHLEMILSLKTGQEVFVSGKSGLPAKELVEIYLDLRCRNVNCKSVLPVDDCDCKFCSTKGFCSSCMCPVCNKFDCASNTCSWVGCDVCSHWCHASCGLENNLIRPLNGEMQFNCIGCHHSSDMFGFVKDVFVSCSKDWGIETLIREIACVKRVFKASSDKKGISLHFMANDLLSKLESKSISSSDACRAIIQFFTYGGIEIYESTASNVSSLTELRELGGLDSLERIIRVKEAEARMFEKKAEEAWKEVVSYRRMIREERGKMDEEHAAKVAKLRLRQTEERRGVLVEELKVLENSHCDYHKMKMRMQSEISSLLESLEASRDQWM